MAWWIFQNVVITAGLAALVVVLCRMSRLGPVAKHWLWVLVLVKFVTPPIVAWPWAMPDPFGLASQQPAFEAAVAIPASGTPLMRLPNRADFTEEPGQGRERVRARAVPAQADVIDRADIRAVSWWWLLAIWAAGSVCLFVVEGIRLLRLRRSIAHSAPGDPAIVMRVATLAEQMGIGQVRVRTLHGSGSPFICGLGRPLLLWPTALAGHSQRLLTETCIDGLLVHELAHIKRRDHLVGWIELAASVVWWWNPLFWFVRAARREQAELACDAWVIAALPDGRRAYAESLLALSTLAPSPTPALAFGIRAHSRRMLERRLVMIMNGRAPLHLPASGLLALALLAAATLPTWAAGGRAQAPESTPIAVTPATSAAIIAAPTQPVVMEGRVRLRGTAPREFDIAVAIDQPPQGGVPQGVRGGVPPPPPRPAKRVIVARPKDERVVWAVRRKGAPAPAEVEPLVQAFERDVEEIRLELERKTEARNDAFVRELQALQDQYTKAGQLDEAVAIRDYLQSWKAGKVVRKSTGLKK